MPTARRSPLSSATSGALRFERATQSADATLPLADIALVARRVCGVPIAVLSVGLLVAQTRYAAAPPLAVAAADLPAARSAAPPRHARCSACTLVARLSRIQEGPRYLVSVAVLLTEVLKLTVCVAVVGGRALQRHWRNAARPVPRPPPAQLARLAVDYMRESVPIAFPALLFTAQSQLNLFAATGLDAVSFQVTNQLKIMPTAAFSAYYLHRRLTLRQWVSLPSLALGVAIVNSATNGSSDTHGGARFGAEWWAGLAAAVTAAVLSGYAGVYCERLLKVGTVSEPAVSSRGWGALGPASTGRAPGAGGSLPPRATSVHGAYGDCAPLTRCAECAERGGAAPHATPPCTCSCAAGAATRTSPRQSVSRLGAPRVALVRPVPRVPLLTLNIQLSAWGAALAGLQVLAVHGPHTGPGPGPLNGFGGYAWAVVALQALGGLVVSMVRGMRACVHKCHCNVCLAAICDLLARCLVLAPQVIKYSDNIVKGACAVRIRVPCCVQVMTSAVRCTHTRTGFAMAISILLSWLLSIPLFGLRPTPFFVVGLALVVASVLLFSAAGAGQHGSAAQPPAGAAPRPRRSASVAADAR